ncbi:MAG: CPBP family intramembrane glutamic endopeptidase [Verrucomicrobiales bacterium]
MKSKPALLLALIVVALWLGITILGGNLQSGGDTTLDELVKAGPLWGVWTALTFLVIVTLASRWKGLGFARPDWAEAFRLMWLPGLFIVGMLGGAFTGTLPAGSVIFWIFVNSMIVGSSEEWAYRRILLKPLRERFPVMTAAILTSVIFGMSHALNGFVTGDFGKALVQAVAASMSGFLFTALRLRTGSLLPVMLLHGLWAVSVFFFALSTAGGTAGPAEASSPAAWIAPVVMVLPNCLYGWYLLRRKKRGELDKEDLVSD